MKKQNKTKQNKNKTKKQNKTKQNKKQKNKKQKKNDCIMMVFAIMKIKFLKTL